MGVFKKICSLLFEETDTEVIAEDELETISFKEPKKEKKVVTEERVQEYYDRMASPEIKEPVKAEVSQPQEHKKIFVDLETDKKPEVEKKEVVKQRTPLKKNESKDYEYTPVISPMFGAKAEVKKANRKDTVSIMKKTAKKPNPLGTIISPYFGVNELEEFEVEAKEELAAKEKEKRMPVDLPENELELANYELQEEKEIHNVSLDELISDEQEIVDEDDMMQISLFGDSAPVRSDDTISFKINEKE